jgi:predicted Zn-dependent protease
MNESLGAFGPRERRDVGTGKRLRKTIMRDRGRENGSAARQTRAAAGLLGGLAALLLASCASIDGHVGEALMAPAALPPRRPGPESKPSPEHARMIALFDGEYKYPAAERYLDEILVKLAAQGDAPSEPYKVTILNSPTVNAFAMPPSSLYVTRGLLALADDGAEVASVMAHEIAHITSRHALQREEEEKRAAVISRTASVIQSPAKGDEIEATARRTIATFSRQQELEADQIGIRAVFRAGFDPYGASRFLAALGRSSALRTSLVGQTASAGKPDILATHPSTPERVTLAVSAARQIGAPGLGTRDRAPYLAAIDGMIFGEDPVEGAIRGRKYLHGRLGFAFTAPDGFGLEATSQAVLGVAADGNEALRLDRVKPPGSATLEAYLASGWIDGLIESSIEPVDVDGLSAVTARARAGEWSFRVAVIRLDPANLFRVIFATRALTPAADERYRTAIGSFHRAGWEEIRAVRPYRIGLVTAKPGDTPEQLAARMALEERALDVFLLVNGLGPAARLEPGERYKIIVE